MLFRVKAETDDAKKNIEETGDEADRLSNIFSKLGMSDFGSKLSSLKDIAGGAAAGIAAVATSAVAVGTALFALAERAAESGTEISRFSTLTGLSAETVGTLKIAAETAGSSLEECEEVWESFIETLIEGGKGADDAKEKLKKAGIDPQQGFKDLEGSLKKGFDAIRAAGTQAEKSAIAMAVFGESGLSMVKVADSMTGGFDEFKKKMVEMGIVMDADGVEQSKEFSRELGQLKKQAEAAGTQFALGFMPAITSAMREISGAVADNKQVWREWGEDVGYILLRFVRGAKVAIAAMKDLFSGSYTATNTVLALQENADNYANDARQQQIKDTLNDPNRPDWLKDQDKNIDNLSRNTSNSNIIGTDKDKDKDPTKNWSLTKVLEAMRKGTMVQESSGDQFAKNKRTDATGLFQILPKNIKKWTRDTFGREMSVEEFKKDAQAQIEIFNKYMGAYLKRGLEMSKGDWNKAIRIAAVQWYGQGKGEGLGYDDPTVFQKGEPTRQQYTSSVLKRTRKFLLGKDSDFDFDSAEKQSAIAERLRAEVIKARENQDRQILNIARQTASEDKAIAEKNLAEKLISEKEYGEKIAAIELTNLETEKLLLQQRLTMTELSAEERAKIEEEIARISSEIKVKTTEAETEAIKATNEELEKQKQINEQIAEMRLEVLRLEHNNLAFKEEQERKILVNDLENAKTKKDRITAEVVLFEFDKKQQDILRQRRIEALNAEEEAAKTRLSEKEKELGAGLELEKKYNALREEAVNEFEARKKEIEDEYKKKKEEFQDDFGGNLLSSIFGSSEQLKQVGDAWTFLGNQIGGVINSMIQGVGSLVQSWVLLGNSGGASIRKFTAQVLASLASQAAVSALFELAKGFAMLFINPAEAGAHFTAAAIFGSIAGVAAIAGRAVAGDSFKQANNTSANNQAAINSGGSSSGRGGSQFSSSGDDRTIIEEDRIRRESVQRYEHVLKLSPGLIVDTVSSNIRDRGELHGLVIQTAEN